MPKGKSIHAGEYPDFLELLIETRKAGGLTQVQLARKAGLSQQYISAVERGGIRLDILQLRRWVYMCGSDLEVFVSAMQKRLQPLDAEGAKVRKTKGVEAK